MVLVATGAFALALLVAPEQGLVARLLQRQRTARRVVLEDVLRVLERLGDGDEVALEPVAAGIGTTPRSLRRVLRRLSGAGLVDLRNGRVRLTPSGVQRARSLSRSHRLWERYLTDVAGMEPEQVHAEAHDLEHHTPPALAEELAEALGNPTHDPHGSPIPSAEGELPSSERKRHGEGAAESGKPAERESS